MDPGLVAVPEPFAAALREGRAREVCDEPAPVPEALYGRGLARMLVGREEDARADLEAAGASLGAPCRVELAYLDIRQRGRVREALAAAREVADGAGADVGLRARALHVAGLAEGKLRRVGGALDALLEAARLYRETGDGAGRARVCDTLGMLHASRGQVELALAHYALSLVDKALGGDHEGMAITLGNLGRLHLRTGRFAEAVDCLERDLALAEGMGDRRGQARVHEDLGRAHAGGEDHARAERSFRRCLDLAERHGFSDLAFFAHRDLAALEVARGDARAARDRIEAAEAALPPGGEPYLEHVLDTARGELLLLEGSPGAVAVLESAVEGLAAADLPDLEIPARILLARAYLARRLKASAERCLLEGVRLARRAGYARYLVGLNEAMASLDVVDGVLEEEARRLASGPAAGAEDYLLRERLGGGGYGEVFRAYDPVRGREVAYKRLHLERIYDGRERDRLARSARVELEAASRVRHPGVARVHSLGREEGGALYVVQEYVEGEPLRARLGAGGDGPAAPILEHLARIADALQALHAAGVVHRDLKPENVIVRKDGTPVLVDFGIAHVTRGGSRERKGPAAGTLEYMAPEQAQGRKVDGRADLYALGVIAFEWLVGFRPLRPQGEDGPARVRDLATRAPPRLGEFRPGLPSTLEDLVASLLEKKPGRRPRDAAAVADLFRALAREARD